MSTPTISFVLGSYNRKPFLRSAIESIRSNGIDLPYEIIVVDGGSTDGSLKWLTAQKDIITIIQHNRGSFRGKAIPRKTWGYFMNLGFKCSQGKFIVMLSDDTLLVPGSVMNAVTFYQNNDARDKKIGAIAFYWRNWPDQKEYWVGLTLGNKMFVNHGMYLRAALQEVGWIDETTFNFYHADGDLCLKLWKQGYEVIDCPGAFVEHFTHANKLVRKANLDGQKSDWQNYINKWLNIYYDPLSPKQGGWIYKPFVDNHHTTRLFPRVPVYFHRIRVYEFALLHEVKQILINIHPDLPDLIKQRFIHR